MFFDAEHSELHIHVTARHPRSDGVRAIRQVLVLRGKPRWRHHALVARTDRDVTVAIRWRFCEVTCVKKKCFHFNNFVQLKTKEVFFFCINIGTAVNLTFSKGNLSELLSLM